SDLSKEDRAAVLHEYKERLINRSLITANDNIRNLKLKDLIASMGYDDVHLTEQLTIEMKPGLDYIYVTFESENPDLSVFVTNTLSNDFIYHHNAASASDNVRALA